MPRRKWKQHIVFCSPHKRHAHVIALDDTTSTLGGTVARFNREWGEWMCWLIEQYDTSDMIYDNSNSNGNSNGNDDGVENDNDTYTYDNYTYDNEYILSQSPHTTTQTTITIDEHETDLY